MERLAAAVVNRQDSDEEDLVDVSVEDSDQNPEAVEDVSQTAPTESACVLGSQCGRPLTLRFGLAFFCA
jgi:hypothetical protein